MQTILGEPIMVPAGEVLEYQLQFLQIGNRKGNVKGLQTYMHKFAKLKAGIIALNTL